VIQHPHPFDVHRTGRTQAMLVQVMDDSLTENLVVVARDRAHQRELFSRLKQMGASSRDGETLRANGHNIFVVTPNRVVPDYDGGWKMQGSSYKVHVDHAALEMLT
jgi:hypothetical protein